MNKKELNLNQLTMEDIDFSDAREGLKEIEEREREYELKYGENWLEHYIADSEYHVSIDIVEEIVNDSIYHGHRPFVYSDPQTLCEIEARYWEKMKCLFGPFYKKYIRHELNNSKVNKTLIKDALKSGKWKELPKNLQDEYHKFNKVQKGI